MADLKALRPRVQRHVLDCPQFIIDTALSDAVRDFLDQTLAWEKEIPFELVAGQAIYEIADEQGAGKDIARVLSIQLEGDEDPLGIADSANDLRIADGKPCAFFGLMPNVFKVGPRPVAAHMSTITLALKPSLDVMDIPDSILSMSGDCIAHGAISRLKMQPGTAWLDPNLAAWHGTQFNSEVHRVRTMKGKGYTAVNQTARSNGFL